MVETAHARPASLTAWITYDEAAEISGLAVQTLRNLACAKKIRKRACGRRRVHRLSLDRYLETGQPQG